MISSLSPVGHVQTERCTVYNHHNEIGGRSLGQYLTTSRSVVVFMSRFCICIPSQREAERGIRFDHLPSAAWDETCLSKGV